MEQLIDYLKEKYDPLALIVYGSYSDHTNNLNSDFDAMIICNEGGNAHDTSTVFGVRLDVFVYSKDYIEKLDDMSEVLQIWDGRIICDTADIARDLKDRVCEYVASSPKLTGDEKNDLRSWCKKMLESTEREDAEGLYRRHWLLTDSLEIWCNLNDIMYFGPKKTILRMKNEDADGFSLYYRALKNEDALGEWVCYLCKSE